jgi:hypothetical protein
VILRRASAKALATMAYVPLVPGRSCDGCTLCCKLATVVSLAKPHGVMCDHCAPEAGCQIYDARPYECREFFCEYRLNPGLSEEWKPLTAHMMMMAQQQERRIYVLVDDGFQGIWRSEPYFSIIKATAVRVLPRGFCVVVLEGDEFVCVLPHKEVRLSARQKFAIRKRMGADGEEYDITISDRASA